LMHFRIDLDNCRERELLPGLQQYGLK